MTCPHCNASMLKYFSGERNMSYWKCWPCKFIEWVSAY